MPGFDSALNLLQAGRYRAVLPVGVDHVRGSKGPSPVFLERTGIKPREYFLVWGKRAEANRPPLARAVGILGHHLTF